MIDAAPSGPEQAEESLRCPSCRAWLQPGFVAVSEGLLWLRNAEGPSNFAEQLPGTLALLKANRLPAWRCQRCELVTLRFGRDPRRRPLGGQSSLLRDKSLHDVG